MDEQFGSVVLLPLTGTMLNKNIIDAIAPLRTLLLQAGVHDFDTQTAGPEHKVKIRTTVIAADETGIPRARSTDTSLYRPRTKSGDPRIWISRVGLEASVDDVLAVAVDYRAQLVVVNLTARVIPDAMQSLYWQQVEQLLQGYSPAALTQCSRDLDSLILRLDGIRANGWLPAVGTGDTSVGRTLETALGIQINSSKKPDWGGIELKFGRPRPGARKNLFAQVPDWELSPLKSSGAILDAFGYEKDGQRRLYVEVGCKPNSKGLYLCVDKRAATVEERSLDVTCPLAVVWRLQKLLDRMTEKHAETLWVTCETRHGVKGEEFLPTEAVHTSAPRLDRFPVLIETGDITVDHLIKRVQGGHVREKGPIWKVSAAGHRHLFSAMQKFALGAN